MKKLFLLIILICAFLNYAQAQDLYVNEFLASNDSCYADEHGDYDDWIEIYNAGSAAVDIGGMFITDDLTDPTAWQIPSTAPDSTTIQAGGFLVLWADKESEQGILHVEIKLSGGGEQIGLYTISGVDTLPIDTLTYSAQNADTSEGRIPDGSSIFDNFINPTPGYTNRSIPLIVNEFMASNDAYQADPYGDFDDWIEIFNAGTSPVDIGGMYVTDDLTDPTQWQIPTTASDTTTIQPGDFLVLWADKESEQGVLHLEIKLGGSGEQIGLYTVSGVDTLPLDTLTYGPQWADTSYGRVTDGANSWEFFTTPTIGAANAGGVVLGIYDFTKHEVISDYNLLQNYPNPFNPVTTIRYHLPNAQKVNISVFNTLGQKVTTLIDGYQKSGYGEIKWNATDFASGIYYYTIKSADFSATRKMILMK